jgi:hypothetical protein
MPRSKDEWYALIRADFAVHSAFVPLEEADFDAALSNALDVWNQYLPILEHRSIKIPNGLVVIDLSDEPDVQGVGDFRYTDSTVDVNRTLTPFYPIQILSMSIQGPRFQFETNQTIERWSRLLGGKEDQIWDVNSKRLFVWNPRGQTNFSFAIIRDTDLTKSESHRYNIFRKLLRAQARLVMVQIFERLGPIPGPDGQMSTDMDAHRSMIEKEMEEVIPVLERMPESLVIPKWD